MENSQRESNSKSSPIHNPFNVSELNAPVKRDTVAEWLKQKNRIQLYAAHKRPFRFKIICRLQVKRWKKVFHANDSQKRAEVTMFIADKIDFQSKTVTRDKDM